MPVVADDRGDWTPVNEAEGVVVPSASKATFTFEPDAPGMFIDTVAVSKHTGMTYELIVDDDNRFGPASIPPTDIDDFVTTHNPRLEVERTLKVVVRNTTNNSLTVWAQIRGVEA